MGGKNPTIVLADADFNSAVENVVNAAFFSTGQKCTATSRAIVEDAIYDKFVAAVVERTRKLKVGDGMQAGIDIGPCVDQAQMETVLRYIEIGRKECGEPRCGGNRLTEGALRQRLLRRAHRLRRTSPKRTPSRAKRSSDRCSPSCAPSDFEDAMRIANDIPFGLSVLDPDHQPLARLRVHLSRRSRPAHRQPAQRRRGIPASLRRHQGFQLRPQGTGSGRARILQRLQDRLPQILIMKLGQTRLNGAVTAAIFEDGGCRIDSGTYRARRDPGSDAGASRASTNLVEAGAHPLHPSARSLGLRLHLRDQRQPSAMPSTARAKACTRMSIAKRGPRSSSRARRGIAWAAATPSASAPIPIHRAGARTRARAWPRPQHLRLHARQRRLRLGHRARERALPDAVQGLRPLLRARPRDRHARTRSPIPITCR